MTAKTRLEITEVGARGDGVSDTPDGLAYVPFTVAGDVVEVTLEPEGKDGFKGEIEKLITAGPTRREAPCPYYGRCGGCNLQHMSVDAYTQWVKERPIRALAQQGLPAPEILDPIISPEGSRRRLSLKALKVESGLLLGFHGRGSHHLVDIESCLVAHSELVALFPAFHALFDDALRQGQGAELRLTLTDSGVDALLSLPGKLDLALRQKLMAFAETNDLAALSVNIDGLEEPVSKIRAPLVHFAGVPVPLYPGAFLQATVEGEAALVEAVLKGVGKAKKVIDLFSGLGTFTFPLAKKAQVLAVEGSLPAIEAMKASFSSAKGFRSIKTEHRDLFRRPLGPQEISKFDAIVLDPPRAGAKMVVENIARTKVPVVVAVSCNPNTFARDAKMLIKGGYTLESIQPIGQFLYSHHVELVAVFRK